MKEKQIQNEIIRRIGIRQDLRIWRANTGVARIDNRVVRFGVPGQADISGILQDGRRLEIEVKAPGGKLSEDQRRFGAIIEKFGGVFIVAYSADEAEEKINQAMRKDS